jgi:hypothetical protein
MADLTRGQGGGAGARPPEPSARPAHPAVATLRREWRRWPRGQRSAALLVLFFVGPLVLVAVGFRVVPGGYAGPGCGAARVGTNYLSYVAVIAFLGAVAGSVMAIVRKGIRIWIRLPVIGLYLLLDLILGITALFSGSRCPMY